MSFIESKSGEQTPNDEKRTFDQVSNSHLKGALEAFNTKLPNHPYFTNYEISVLPYTTSSIAPTPKTVSTFVEKLRNNGIIPYRRDMEQSVRILHTREEALAINSLLWATRYQDYTLRENPEAIDTLLDDLGEDDLIKTIKPAGEQRAERRVPLNRPASRRVAHEATSEFDPNWETDPNYQNSEKIAPKVVHEARSMDDKAYFTQVTDKDMIESATWTVEKFESLRERIAKRDSWKDVSTIDIPGAVLKNLIIINEAETQLYRPVDDIMADITYGELVPLLSSPESYLVQFPQIKSLGHLMKRLKRKYTGNN